MTINIKIKGQGPALALFHGWGFDQSVWDELVLVLQHHFQLYLVDLPGFGNSHMMSWTHFKTSLLDALPPKIAVLGWSLGGLYAMRLAIEAPTRVSSIFITASSPCFIKRPDWPGIEKTVFDGFFANLKHDPQKTIQDFIKLQGNNADLQPAKAYAASFEGLTQGLEILNQWDLRALLEDYPNPVCFVFGRLDTIVPRATLKVMQQRYPAFQYRLFPGAAHMPFLSHQKEYLDVLVEFLA